MEGSWGCVWPELDHASYPAPRWTRLTAVGRPFTSKWHSTITAGMQKCTLRQSGSGESLG